MALSEIVKNIYTFANILSQAHTDVVRQWDLRSINNAINWAKYCIKIEEQTRNRAYRSHLNTYIQSLTILLNPVSLFHIDIGQLGDSLNLLRKILAQNGDTPSQILAAVQNVPGSSVGQPVGDKHETLLRSGSTLYKLVGTDTSFADQSIHSQAGHIIDRLVCLHRIDVSSQHRYDRFLEKLLTEILKLDNGWVVLMHMFMTHVLIEEDHNVTINIKEKLLDMVRLTATDFNCELWRCDCALLCGISACDDRFCDMYIEHLLSWADHMLPVYGLMDNGDLYHWRQSDWHGSNSHDYKALKKHVCHVLGYSNTLNVKLKAKLPGQSEKSYFSVWNDLLRCSSAGWT